MQNRKIMVVDEDSRTQKSLKSFLLKNSFNIDILCNANDALAKITSDPHQIVITEIQLQGFSGIEFLKEIKAISSITPVIILTSFGTIDIAVESIQCGASDFLTKPFNEETILLSINNILKNNDKKSNSRFENLSASGHHANKEFRTISPEMLLLLTRAKKIANSNSSVLIQGESGTGKELLAAYIVSNSGREKMPYVTMNCAALPDSLAESELFGHEKGAFTGAYQSRKGKFEQAHLGTLLLDEISELGLPLQAKLLRVLQEKKVDRIGGERSILVDTRIISTCNVDLNDAIKKGNFRKDLFYRINVIPITIPPLRKRKEDIPVLTEYFIRRHSALNKKIINGLSKEALSCLCAHDWYGNVRELENVIERAVLITDQQKIEKENLLIDRIDSENENIEFPVGTTVKEMERKLIFNTLNKVNENRTHAAQLLGISIRTLRNKLHEYRSAAEHVNVPILNE